MDQEAGRREERSRSVEKVRVVHAQELRLRRRPRRMLDERSHEVIDRIGLEHRVIVEEKHELARRCSDSLVVCSDKAEVLIVPQHSGLREARGNPGKLRVGAAVVDHDQLEVPVPLSLDRFEASLEIGAASHRRYDDRDGRRPLDLRTVRHVIASFLKALPIPVALRRLLAEIAIAERERRGSDLEHVRTWPDRLDAFEDLTFLFTSTILAHGVASLRLDEAAYLYRLVRDTQPETVVEIGRFRGGSTVIIAAALEQGVLHSYDIDVRQGRDGAELDRQLIRVLDRYGLTERVRLHVADSRSAEPLRAPVDILFVDGDHREDGVRADLEHWRPRLRPGGHLLFHDAVDAPDFVSPAVPGPTRVANSVGDDFERLPGAGSIAHLVRGA